MTSLCGMIAHFLIGLVALSHIGFMMLEMFLWQKPAGRKIFRMSADQARATATLAANQGLYNGFLAAGLVWSLFYPAPDAAPGVAAHIAVFFLSCVVVAGIYGAYSVSRRIFFVQAVPALAALAALYFGL